MDEAFEAIDAAAAEAAWEVIQDDLEDEIAEWADYEQAVAA